MRVPTLIGTIVLFSSSPATAQSPAEANSYVKQAVEMVAAQRAGLGYDIRKAFTRNLRYGNDCCINATGAPLTMCVAAAGEVIVEALNKYAANTGDFSFTQKLPISSWRSGRLQSIRANLFMFAGTGSRGTGYTLEAMGIGREKNFTELKPYDFVNFNRARSGHAAIFIGYLKPGSVLTSDYSPDVIGFRYFSAQGRGKPDAGMAYRNAYFDGHCPAAMVDGVRRDCGVIRSNTNKRLLDGGTLYLPGSWTTEQAKRKLETNVRSAIASRNPGATRAFIDNRVQAELTRTLTPDPAIEASFTGETTD